MKIEGLPVRNASKSVKIIISKGDAKFGLSKTPGSCAAARAALRQVPKCTEALIHISRSFLKVGGHWLRFATPKSLRSEIIAFDRGGKFEVGEFMLHPLSLSTRKTYGKRRGSKPKFQKGRPGFHRAKQHRFHGVREFSPTKAAGIERERNI